jgi:hypothetical protein
MGKGKSTSRKGKADKGLASASSAPANDSGADHWLSCIGYQFQVNRVDGNFRFLFSAYDSSGARHSLELDDEADRPQLAQDLYDALQIWPRVDIQFKSKKVDQAAYPQITDIQRVHPRA